VIAEFSIAPIREDGGDSLSEFVAEMIDLVDRSGLDYRLTAMGTLVEGDRDAVFDLVRECHEAMIGRAPRVLTTIRIDDRRGVKDGLSAKVRSVEKKLGRDVKK
jgi:uncharacterized protein (TIGR00106 family)